MSGNGTRFVWWGVVGEAEDEDVVERALVHEVEAGFVAVEEGNGRAVGEGGEGIGDAVEGGTGGLGGGLPVQEAGFHGPGPAQAPIGGSHVLDHAKFEAIGGPEVTDVVGE